MPKISPNGAQWAPMGPLGLRLARAWLALGLRLPGKGGPYFAGKSGAGQKTKPTTSQEGVADGFFFVVTVLRNKFEKLVRRALSMGVCFFSFAQK